MNRSKLKAIHGNPRMLARASGGFASIIVASELTMASGHFGEQGRNAGNLVGK